VTKSRPRLNDQEVIWGQTQSEARRSSAHGATDAGITACILARPREVPSFLMSPSFSWPVAGPSLGDNRSIPTVTAVSALAFGDVRPGYFGSDLPRPRRLRES
jgi:hypothetical protein